MKKCPYCAEEIQDEELQCWNCGEWFDIISPPQQEAVVKPPKKEQSGTVYIDWKTKLGDICNEYKAPIIGIVIIAIILLTISQTPNFNKSAKQITAVKLPRVETPSAPAPVPDPGSAPVPAPVPAPASAPAPAPAPAPVPAPATESALAPESARAHDSANNLLNDASALCSNGKCTDPLKAIEYLNEAIKLKPDLAEAYNNRGNAYVNLGQHQQAITDYNEAIRLKPDYDHAYSNRGSAYFIQGNNLLGCSDAQKACELGNCQLLEDFKGKGLCR